MMRERYTGLLLPQPSICRVYRTIGFATKHSPDTDSEALERAARQAGKVSSPSSMY